MTYIDLDGCITFNRFLCKSHNSRKGVGNAEE